MLRKRKICCVQPKERSLVGYDEFTLSLRIFGKFSTTTELQKWWKGI